MESTSISLLGRIQSGKDELAWERFVEIYAPVLFHWSAKFGVPQQEIADCVQDIFAHLLRRLPEFTYDSRGSFRSWLKVVTRNQCFDFQRKRNAVSRKAMPLDFDPVADAESSADDQQYLRMIANRALDFIRDDFESTTWTAFQLQVVDGMTPQQAANKLDVSVNAVYLAKSRVLRRLRIELDGLWE